MKNFLSISISIILALAVIFLCFAGVQIYSLSNSFSEIYPMFANMKFPMLFLSEFMISILIISCIFGIFTTFRYYKKQIFTAKSFKNLKIIAGCFFVNFLLSILIIIYTDFNLDGSITNLIFIASAVLSFFGFSFFYILSDLIREAITISKTDEAEISDMRFKKVLISLILVFVIAIPILRTFSDIRPQAVKKVSNLFDLNLKNAEFIAEKRKDESFFGDGEEGILLKIESKDKKEIEEKLKNLETENEEVKENVEFVLNTLKKKGFKIEPDFKITKIYFKSESPNDEYPFANFKAILLDESEKNCRVLYIGYDS